MKETPSINSRSKRIAEKKLLETSISHGAGGSVIVATEVYNRLYELGKARVHQRMESSPMHVGSPSKLHDSNNVMSNGGASNIEQSIKGDIRSDYSFQPQI